MTPPMSERILIQNLSSASAPADEVRRLLALPMDTQIETFERRHLRRLLFSPFRLWRTLRGNPPGRHVVLVDQLYARPHPFRTTFLALLQGAGARLLLDRRGCIAPLRWHDALFRDLVLRAGSGLQRARLHSWARAELQRIRGGAGRPRPRFDAGRPLLFVLCDPLLDYVAGGIGAHVSGVVSGMRACGVDVRFMAVDKFGPVESLGLATHVAHWGSVAEAEEGTVGANRALLRDGRGLLASVPVGCVYQRAGLHAFAGAALALEAGVPFVHEYNGSEVWVAEHWAGGRAHLPELSRQASAATEALADLIVVVSDVLRQELVGRGVPAEKILVQPNAVDTARFRPDLDGSARRREFFGAQSSTGASPMAHGQDAHATAVVGFAGTFGKWHGAEILARAAGLASRRNASLRWLFVGDGATAATARRIVEEAGAGDRARFTGLVPQADMPGYLAACDILVSPTLNNPDGSPFFGSPTKLFEYMAMGRAIVVSRVGQLAEVIEDGKNGVVVEPGNAQMLADALCALADDPQRRVALGQAARARCEARHTWTQAAQNILKALRERCP